MAIGFNEDLTTQIFLRLPVKSVLRFKTVSKQWLSIASSPRFRQIHASRIGKPTGLFFTKCPAPIPKLEFLPLKRLEFFPTTFPLFDYPISIISSSGGLLLLLSKSCQSFNLQLSCVRDYFVCNPTTNEFKHLAAVPKLIGDSKLVCETLAFDPSKSPHYKIAFLCKYHELNNQEFQIVIYSSENQTFSSPQATTLVNFRCSGVYCYDAIHWISYHNYNYSFYYYDIKRECMKESPLPPNLFRFAMYFGESRGHLHLVTSVEYPQKTLLEVHELKSDYSGWSIKYKVDVASLKNHISKEKIYSAISNGQFTVLSITVDAETEESVNMWFLVYGSFVVCNFKHNRYIWGTEDPRYKMHGSRYDRNRDRMYGWPVAHQYIKTLACVDLPKRQVTCSNKKQKRCRSG